MFPKLHYLFLLVSQQTLDIGVLVGGSSIETFEKAKEALRTLLKQYDLNNGKTQFGIVESSQIPSLLKSLTREMNKASILKLVDGLSYDEDRANLVKGVTFSKSALFKDCSDKPCKEKTFVVLTDEKPDQRTKGLLDNMVKNGVKVVFTFLTPRDGVKPSDIALDGDNIAIKVIKIKDYLDGIVGDIIGLIDPSKNDSITCFFSCFSCYITTFTRSRQTK